MFVLIILVFPVTYHPFLIVSQVFIIRVSISIAIYIGVINEMNVSCMHSNSRITIFHSSIIYLIKLLFLFFFFFEAPNQSNPSSAT